MVDCHLLYEQFRLNLGTHKVTVTVQGLAPDSSGTYRKAGPKLFVPQLEAKLYTYCESGFSHYRVEVDYTAGTLLPDTLMTRAEFLMELLDIWGTMRTRLSPALTKTVGKDLDLVLKLTRSVYSVGELADMGYLEK